METFSTPDNIENVDEFIKTEIQFAIDHFRTDKAKVIDHYVAASWILGEPAITSKKIDVVRDKKDGNLAKELYLAAYDTTHGEGVTT